MASGHAPDDNSTTERSSGTPTTVSVEFLTRDEHGPAGVVRDASGATHRFSGWLDLMSRLEAITESDPRSNH